VTALNHHVWRTADGAHVPHGHPDAAFLAYPAGDLVPVAVLAELDVDKPVAQKRASRPADKQVKASEGDKGT